MHTGGPETLTSCAPTNTPSRTSVPFGASSSSHLGSPVRVPMKRLGPKPEVRVSMRSVPVSEQMTSNRTVVVCPLTATIWRLSLQVRSGRALLSGIWQCRGDFSVIQPHKTTKLNLAIPPWGIPARRLAPSRTAQDGIGTVSVSETGLPPSGITWIVPLAGSVRGCLIGGGTQKSYAHLPPL